jgi:RNA polymerase-binding transcription factor DksA
VDSQATRTTLEQLLRELDSATQTLEGEGAGETSELSHVTQHPGDVGTEVADNDRETAVLEAADERRAEVEAALARLDAGTYGRCVDCGQEIDAARLEYRPEAARCLADQEKHEAANA